MFLLRLKGDLLDQLRTLFSVRESVVLQRL